MQHFTSRFPRYTLLVAALAIATSLRADGPKAIVARWAEAIGGAERIRAIDTIHRIADVTDDGTPGVEDEWITGALGRRERIDHTHDQTLEVFDGHNAWRKDWNGFVERLDGDDVKRETALAIVHGFGALTGRAGAPELVSEGVIRFHPPGGLPVTYAIDKETGLPLRAEMPSFNGVATIAFSDWRDVNGIRIPFIETIENGPSKSEVHLRSADLHPAVPVPLVRPESGPNDVFFLQHQRSETVPFNFDSKHILIRGTINGAGPIWLLVDTGANLTILNQSRLDEMHVKPYGGMTTTGGGDAAASGSFAENVTYRVGGVELQNQHAGVLELRGLEKLYGVPIGALLGFDFISRFVMAIDYAHNQLTLYDRSHSTARERGTRVPLVMQGEEPYLAGGIRVVGETIPCWFILDVGAADTITFTTPFVAAHQLLDRAGDKSRTVQRLTAPDVAAFAPTNTRGLIDGITIGSVTLPHVLVNLSVAKKGAYTSSTFDGNIGETLLARFSRVVLDYGRSEMILEPGSDTAKPMPERKVFGMTVIAEGRDFTTFTATAVGEGSSAARAGFQKGDIIAAVDGKPASQLTLASLKAILAAEGTRHVFKVTRSSGLIELPVTIELAPLSGLQ